MRRRPATVRCGSPRRISTRTARIANGVNRVRLASWASGAGLAALVAGLLLFGRDGRMATYLLLVLASAAALWWSGFGPGRR